MRFGSALLCLLLSSCGPSTADAIRRHRAAAEAKEATFRAAADLVKNAAAVGAPEITLDGPAPDFPPCMGKENALVLDPYHFNYPEPPAPQFRLAWDNPVANALSLLKKGTLADGSAPRNGDAAEDILERFIRLRYLLVVRVTRLIEPRDSNPIEFRGGALEGIAHLVDLEQKKIVATLPFESKSSEKVSVDPKNVEAFLRSDLAENAKKGLREFFKERYKDQTPPFHQ